MFLRSLQRCEPTICVERSSTKASKREITAYISPSVSPFCPLPLLSAAKITIPVGHLLQPRQRRELHHPLHNGDSLSDLSRLPRDSQQRRRRRPPQERDGGTAVGLHLHLPNAAPPASDHRPLSIELFLEGRGWGWERRVVQEGVGGLGGVGAEALSRTVCGRRRRRREQDVCRKQGVFRQWGLIRR